MKAEGEQQNELNPSRFGRKSFSTVRRYLTDEELSSPGVQKLLIDMLEEAENKIIDLEQYIKKYYLATNEANILKEKLMKDKTIDMFFGVGVGLGGVVLGLVPFFYENNPIYGVVCGLVGLVMVVGSAILKVRK